MIPAFLTAALFALSASTAQRSAKQLGANEANLARLCIAMVLLGIVAHTWGGGLGGAGLPWLLLSGLIGFGIGDVGIFNAFPRIGARLTVLLTQCLAAPIAGVAEWLLLGEVLRVTQILLGGTILVGVAFALLPGKHDPPKRQGSLLLGIAFGIVGALGQGLGAVTSRMAYAAAEAAGEPVAATTLEQVLHGMTAAYQRIVAGVAFAACFLLFVRWRNKARATSAEGVPPATLAAKGFFVTANALSGPFLGVSMFQFALATTESAVVLPIVALTPIFVMPLSRWLEGDRPSARSLAGGVVAVAAAVILAGVS